MERWCLSGVDGPSLQLLLHAVYSKRLPLTAEGAAQDVPRLLAASNYLEVRRACRRCSCWFAGPCLHARVAATWHAGARQPTPAPPAVLPTPSCQVLPVKEACCHFLRCQLSLDTVAATLSLAAAHDCADLLADAASRTWAFAWDGEAPG